jgi:sugar lactone lactonase YvrE
VSDLRVVVSGLAYGESPRWHEGRLWLANWCTGQVLAVTPQGETEIVARVPSDFPFSLDWLPDGTLLVVSGREALLLRLAPDGTFSTYADLTAIEPMFNELVVDARGNAYVDSGGVVALVPAHAPDRPRKVAEGLEFGNGMAVTADGGTLIVAESHGGRLTGFPIEEDGGLGPGFVWAHTPGGSPDGVCLDAEGAVWYADVPARRCVRVEKGGRVLATVEADRGCFGCMLGGADGRDLYVTAAEWHGTDNMTADSLTGRLLVTRVEVPHAGRP